MARAAFLGFSSAGIYVHGRRRDVYFLQPKTGKRAKLAIKFAAYFAKKFKAFYLRSSLALRLCRQTGLGALERAYAIVIHHHIGLPYYREIIHLANNFHPGPAH